MDRTTTLARLAKAEQAVELGERHLLRQRELVAELTRHRHDVAMAARLLATFEQSQTLHVADCDRLSKELLTPWIALDFS